MANDSSKKGLTALAKKKLVAGVTALVVVAAVWQIAALFQGETPPAPAAPAAAPAASTPVVPASSVSFAGRATAPAASEGIQPVGMDTLENNAALLKQQQKKQSVWLDRIDRLQSLRIEKEIADNSKAIADARLETAKSELAMSYLLTKSAEDMGPKETVPVSGPASQLAPAAMGAESVIPAPPPAYSLVSVTRQLGKWSAVLAYQNTLLRVSVGDTLAADGSVVTAINRESVSLKKGRETKQIQIAVTP